MREFLDTMMKDIQKENFTKREVIVYGVIAPIMLVAVMDLAGWIDSLL